MATQLMRRCTNSLIIRAMQNKTILRCYFSPIGLAEIPKFMRLFYWWSGGEIGIHCCWGLRKTMPYSKRICKYIEKYVHLPFDEETLLLRIHSKDTKASIQNDKVNLCSIICNCRWLETIQISINNYLHKYDNCMQQSTPKL